MAWKWIQLVGTEKILAADCVLLAGEEQVVFLRKAVKAAYPNVLAHLDAGQLKIYATRAIYLDENSNRQPLASSTKLIGLGDTEDAALVVEVPKDGDGVVGEWEFAQDTWIQAILADRVHSLPLGHAALCRYLERELPQPMPVDEARTRQLRTVDTTGMGATIATKLFVELDQEDYLITSPLVAKLVDNLILPPTRGSPTDKESYIHFWDELIAIVLENVTNGKGTSTRYADNADADTPTDICRPDLAFYYTDRGSKVCVFRGEEQCEGDMKMLLDEMARKFIWRYDDAPYVFGYAAIAQKVALVVIRRGRGDPYRAITELVHTYNLKVFTDRLAFLLALLNLSTLFAPVVAQVRAPHVPDFGDLVEPNNVKLC